MTGKWRSWISAATLAALTPSLGAAAPPPVPAPPIIQIGSAYFAKQFCSCLFVVGRSEISCRAEFRPQIDNFSVAVDRTGLPNAAKVTARLGQVVAEATFVRRFGCVLAR